MTKSKILITSHDAKMFEKVIEMVYKLYVVSEQNIDYEVLDDMLETLRRTKHNLTHGGYYYKRLPKTEQHWYNADCSKCGWYGSSEYCLGGEQIADTGDYSDATCPICGSPVN